MTQQKLICEMNVSNAVAGILQEEVMTCVNPSRSRSFMPCRPTTSNYSCTETIVPFPF